MSRLTKSLIGYIDSMVETRVNVLVFAHGPHLLDALTAHGIGRSYLYILLVAYYLYYTSTLSTRLGTLGVLVY